MPKKKEKKVVVEEPKKISTKEELLEYLNERLKTQQLFATQLEQDVFNLIGSDDNSADIKKKRYHSLNVYNQQVEAVLRTSAGLIKIYNSSLKSDDEDVIEEETEQVEEELVD